MDNFLNAYGVWWLPGTLLSAAAFIFAAVYGVCVGLSGYVAWNGSAGHVDPTGESILLGVCSFVLALGECIFICVWAIRLTMFFCYSGFELLHLCAARCGGLRVRVLRHGPRQAAALAPGGARSVRGGQGEDGEGSIRDGCPWGDGRRTRIGGGLQLRRQCRRSREGTGRKHRVRPRRRRCPLSLSETSARGVDDTYTAALIVC